MATTTSTQSDQLNALVQSGQTEKAVKLLAQMAVASARKNDFELAESYRDQIYEIDSMALTAIVSVNEVIEAEKSKALTPDRRRLWVRFFEGLSAEEANAFFFALREKVVEAEQTIQEQGNGNDCLYLINSGQLRMIHEREDKQFLIQTLGAGDIFGEDTFFSINVCTASVATISKSRISYLERERLEQLKAQYSHLERHLQKICGSGQRIYNWLRRKGIDRRAYRRINFPNKITFQVLSSDQKEMMARRITAEMWDISKNGLSFYFHSKNKKAVRQLLGRTLGVHFMVDIGKGPREVAVTGVVQGVQDHPLDEYSVHIKLRRSFSDDAMKTITRIANDRG